MQGDGEVLFLGGAGEVAVTVRHDGLSFEPLHPERNSSCWSSFRLQPKLENKIKFSDVYAVQLLDEGPVYVPWNTGIVAQGKKNTEMHRFAVHVITRSRKCPSAWVPCEYLFGHGNLDTCKSWVEHLSARINNEQDRPKNLLVFVHPVCGKGRGCKNWETVAPLFDQAKVNTKVITTERAGHAYDTLASLSDKELKKFDGVVAVGGDGLFNEILNGLLSSRHKTSYPPTPEGFGYFGSNEKPQGYSNHGLNDSLRTSDAVNGMLPGDSNKSDDHEPLLSTTQSAGLDISSSNPNTEPSSGDQVPLVSFPNDWFRLGIIPSGSTDAIALRYWLRHLSVTYKETPHLPLLITELAFLGLHCYVDHGNSILIPLKYVIVLHCKSARYDPLWYWTVDHYHLSISVFEQCVSILLSLLVLLPPPPPPFFPCNFL